MSIRDIMGVFDLSESTVKMRLKRAKAKAVNFKTEMNKDHE